jgi:hypothetical protein
MQAELTLAMDFTSFKTSQPARQMFRKLGLLDYLEAAQSWRHLRQLIVEFNGCDDGRFVAVAKITDGTCSSGERVLLHAILYVTDFAWLADKFAKGKAWQRMGYVGGEWREAVAACIAAEL